MPVPRTPTTWKRLVKNRAFLAELLANPEATLRKYNLKMDEKSMIHLGELTDSLVAHMSRTLVQPGDTALLDCSNACL